MKKGLITVSLILMGLSLYGIIESSRLERTMKMGVGIGFLPFWMSVTIGSLALVLLVKILRGKMQVADKPIFQKERVSRVTTLVVLLCGYLLLIEGIGYVPSTFLFFSATIFVLRKGRIVNTLLASGGFTLLLYAIFRLWLKSPLPTGFLGI
jgi:putative tricarboxylic transport membrane protein